MKVNKVIKVNSQKLLISASYIHNILEINKNDQNENDYSKCEVILELISQNVAIVSKQKERSSLKHQDLKFKLLVKGCEIKF